MIRLLSPPGLLTGLVVMASVATGIALGAAVAGSALVVGAVARRMRP